MRLSNIISEFAGGYTGQFTILRWDEYATEYDPWEIAEYAEKIALKSGIRIRRNKELCYIAMDTSYGEPLIGATWRSIYEDEMDSNSFIYDFDVAVDSDFRSPSAKVGYKLIDATLEDFEAEKASYDGRMRVEVLVVNPKLARALERDYGFEITGEHGDISYGKRVYQYTMEYYGKRRRATETHQTDEASEVPEARRTSRKTGETPEK